MFEVKNKNIFITGSSRGIGAGLALKLAEAGAKVTITYGASKAAAEKLYSDLPGEGHLLLQMDMNDENSVKAAIDEALVKWDNKIDGLVNNAGITRDQLLLRMSGKDFDDVYQTNLRGSFYTTKLIMKPMMK